MEKKLDTILCGAALFGVIVCLLWIAVPVVRTGLSHADDAFFAILAKNVALGKGYGYQKSSNEFRVMDPYINSTGPSLVLPIALLIRIFGPLDQLPGAATFSIFLGQLLVAAFLLSRRCGWKQTFGFLFGIVLLLILASSNNWYFGTFFGETPAFGFILVGMTSLAVSESDRAVAAAALCFSLAFLTKQISLFAVGGIVAAWLVISFYERKERKLILRQSVILVLVASGLPLIFEAAKLITLGLDGYKRALKATWDVTAIHAVGLGDRGARLTTFVATMRGYMPPLVIIALALLSVLLLVLFRRTQNRGREPVERFALFAWPGAATYLAYILMISTLWSRYFWIGIALLLTAICAPLLAFGTRLRMVTITIVVLLVIGLGLYRKPLLVREWNRSAPADRAVAMKLLDDNPELPYAAQTGSSLNDILYLRGDQGTWACEPELGKNLRNRNFIALINDVFTDKKLRFFKTVVATCKPLTPQARTTAYRCGDQFWTKYIQPFESSSASTISSAKSALPYSGIVDRRDCETIAGWVMSPADLDADIKVELYVDEKLVETRPARDLRPDLTGRVGTGRYGFGFTMPSLYRDSKPHAATIKVADSDYVLPFLENVFPDFECRP